VEGLDGVLVTGRYPGQQFRVLHHRLTPGGSGWAAVRNRVYRPTRLGTIAPSKCAGLSNWR